LGAIIFTKIFSRLARIIILFNNSKSCTACSRSLDPGYLISIGLIGQFGKFLLNLIIHFNAV